ncbi:phenylalanyl-tRNA synthetase [Peniophora sp. CONT]|nr:phenylalanyl-tRNA synthetase [Peniophora sp. CONT]
MASVFLSPCRRAAQHAFFLGSARRALATAAPKPSEITVLGQPYPTDGHTNVTPAIVSKLSRKLWLQKGHPIATLRGLIESHFSSHEHLSSDSPLVTSHQNFDSLSFPADHPGRSKTDSYYINKDLMLRTHTSAHEVEVFAKGSEKWLLTADVYRRDEIDASHYPAFHQMEGAHIFGTSPSDITAIEKECERMEAQLAKVNIEITDVPHVSSTNPVQPAHTNAQAELAARHLKLSLNGLMYKLFAGAASASEAEPLRVRWIEAEFPFTSPSFEVEVFFRGKWLEILGSGVVLQSTLDRASVPNKLGWAFGLGLERIAMILYSIPDIRLFWSEDHRFLDQFTPGMITTFQPWSKYPPSKRDISFWLPESEVLHENDIYDLVRDVAGDLVEDVAVHDRFTHPKTGRNSVTYRITYRSMSRTLTTKKIEIFQDTIKRQLAEQLGAEIR